MAAICRKPCFWDPHGRRGESQWSSVTKSQSVCSARDCVQGALMRRGRTAGVGVTPWVPVGGDSWSSCTGRVAAGGCAGRWARGGPSGAVNDRGAESCMCGLLDWCGGLNQVPINNIISFRSPPALQHPNPMSDEHLCATCCAARAHAR